VVAVNDLHVMGAWATASGGMGKIHFLSDWNAAFTKAIGMDIDLSAGTLGIRSKRYSMLVEDGIVKALNVEDVPSQAIASGAATMLEQLS
jgi:peroxiredoxin